MYSRVGSAPNVHGLFNAIVSRFGKDTMMMRSADGQWRVRVLSVAVLSGLIVISFQACIFQFGDDCRGLARRVYLQHRLVQR